MDEEIPLASSTFSEEAIRAAADVLRSGWSGPGSEVGAFERELAARVGASFAVATGSATDALQIAVTLADLPVGAEVITTPNTFVSTNHVLLWAGLVPVFADIETHTGNIDVDSIAAQITEATRAIMVVHYAGYPCDLDGVYELARRHELVVIEDGAHALGARYRGRPIGSHGGLCAFSFQSTKNLSTVDGGALMIGDGELAARARRLRWMGIDADTYERHTETGYHWEYDVAEVGFRSTMSDLNAAIGRAGLSTLDAGNARRAEIADRYRAGLATLDGVEPMRHDNDRISAHYLFAVTFEEGRDRVLAHLRDHGVGAGVHYKANDRYPVYKPAYLPAAHWFADHVLSLPMHIDLRDDQVDRVIELVTEVLT